MSGALSYVVEGYTAGVTLPVPRARISARSAALEISGLSRRVSSSFGWQRQRQHGPRSVQGCRTVLRLGCASHLCNYGRGTQPRAGRPRGCTCQVASGSQPRRGARAREGAPQRGADPPHFGWEFVAGVQAHNLGRGLRPRACIALHFATRAPRAWHGPSRHATTHARTGRLARVTALGWALELEHALRLEGWIAAFGAPARGTRRVRLVRGEGRGVST